jgi:hypothetical protein
VNRKGKTCLSDDGGKQIAYNTSTHTSAVRFHDLDTAPIDLQFLYFILLYTAFNAKVGRDDIFKPTIGNKSLHEIGDDNGVRVVNFATSKNLIVKSTMFPHCNIHKIIWTSPNAKMHNQIDQFERL